MENNKLTASDLKGLSAKERFAIYEAPAKKRKQVQDAIISANAPVKSGLQKSLAFYKQRLKERQRAGKNVGLLQDRIEELITQVAAQQATDEFMQKEGNATVATFQEFRQKLVDRGATDEQLQTVDVAFGVWRDDPLNLDYVNVADKISDVSVQLDQRDRQRVSDAEHQSLQKQVEAAELQTEAKQIQLDLMKE